MYVEVPLKRATRLLNTGCVVLVTSAHRDRINVMSLAWQTPLSGRPPLVGISVALSHFTHELIDKSMQFVLNIPAMEMLQQVGTCGKSSGRDGDKFALAGITPVSARKIKAPLIKECLGHIECGVVERTKAGDHSFFIGEVLAAGAEEQYFSDGFWKEDVELIHHLGSRYYYCSGRRTEL